jgi:L-aspartate-alpha-decarboxylase
MLRQFLLGKIHRATVTRVDINYMGSITLDPLLIEAAGFLENEKIDIYDITNGSRLSTYVISGIPGSGEVGINGAAAHLVQMGDLVIVASYGWMGEAEAASHVPKVIIVDEKNRITSRVSHERTI